MKEVVNYVHQIVFQRFKINKQSNQTLKSEKSSTVKTLNHLEKWEIVAHPSQVCNRTKPIQNPYIHFTRPFGKGIYNLLSISTRDKGSGYPRLFTVQDKKSNKQTHSQQTYYKHFDLTCSYQLSEEL